MNLDIKKNEVKLFRTYKYESAFKDVYYLKKDIDLKNEVSFRND